jgi:hypothetical protein
MRSPRRGIFGFGVNTLIGPISLSFNVVDLERYEAAAVAAAACTMGPRAMMIGSQRRARGEDRPPDDGRASAKRCDFDVRTTVYQHGLSSFQSAPRHATSSAANCTFFR